MKKYDFDHSTKVLTASEAFMEEAGKCGTPEYNVIMTIRKDYPDMSIEICYNTRKSKKTDSISYSQMKHFISQCRDANKRINVFNTVYELSKAQNSPYTYMKKWFLENYANYSNNPEFDDDGFVIVKTKVQMDAERKTAVTPDASIQIVEDTKIQDSDDEQSSASGDPEIIPSGKDVAA